MKDIIARLNELQKEIFVADDQELEAIGKELDEISKTLVIKDSTVDNKDEKEVK